MIFTPITLVTCVVADILPLEEKVQGQRGSEWRRVPLLKRCVGRGAELSRNEVVDWPRVAPLAFMERCEGKR